MKNIFTVCILSLVLVGCTSHEGRSSGIIGCPAEEIQVSNKQTQFETVTWTAQCRGKTFYCTGYSGGATTCAPALKTD